MNGSEQGVWFPPGASVVLLPRSDRRCASLGITMYAASGRLILAAQWLAWLWLRALGPAHLPGRAERLDVPELSQIGAALGYGRALSVAMYRRRDVRGGMTFIATWTDRAHLVKVRAEGAGLEVEQRLLTTVQKVRPRSFRAPRPAGFGRLPDGRYWSAQEVVFTAPHRACLDLPDGFESDLAKVLQTIDEPAAREAGSEPAHGDLSPWNLRRDHRGRLWLFDWEDAAAAPRGADRAYFEAAVGVLRPRRPMPAVDPSGASYWAARIRERLASGHPHRPNTIMLERLTRVLATHGDSATPQQRSTTDEDAMNQPARLLSAIATRIKGTDYRLDERISTGSLLRIAAERAGMRSRAVLTFGSRGRHGFVGRRVTIRARNMIHLGSGVTFGHGSMIDAISTDGVWLGDNVSLGRNSRIECSGTLRDLGKGIRVGTNVGLGTDCFYGCAGGIEIGADTLVGNFVSFHSENHVTDRVDLPIRDQGVTHQGIVVGRDCWIGAKATILDGAHIGDGSVIAAGSVVTAGDYPARGIYGGVPARLLKSRD